MLCTETAAWLISELCPTGSPEKCLPLWKSGKLLAVMWVVEGNDDFSQANPDPVSQANSCRLERPWHYNLCNWKESLIQNCAWGINSHVETCRQINLPIWPLAFWDVWKERWILKGSKISINQRMLFKGPHLSHEPSKEKCWMEGSTMRFLYTIDQCTGLVRE